MSFEEDFATGRARMRARCAAIVQSEEAKGRDALALHLAVETDLTAEQAIAALALAPKSAPPVQRSPSQGRQGREPAEHEERISALEISLLAITLSAVPLRRLGRVLNALRQAARRPATAPVSALRIGELVRLLADDLQTASLEEKDARS
jgi:hypothetical protein